MGRNQTVPDEQAATQSYAYTICRHTDVTLESGVDISPKRDVELVASQKVSMVKLGLTVLKNVHPT